MSDTKEYNDDLMPRPERKPRRDKSERGLPPDDELRKLVETYLSLQRELWKDLVENGLIPEPSEEVITQLVDEFKVRHKTRKLNSDQVKSRFSGHVRTLGASYNRYSTHNSSPNSIRDQMYNSLNKAKEDDCFIPIEFVFADYAISGTDPTRKGYVNCKQLIKAHSRVIETVYIDDWTRAARDELEWWNLAKICKRMKINLRGASDGFDLYSEHSQILMFAYGLLSSLFLKGIREKVSRGMKSTARDGGSVGKPPIGLTRKVRRDSDGNIVRRPDGRPRYVYAIHEQTAKIVEWIFRLYLDKNWSTHKIANHFNRKHIDNNDCWSHTGLRNILRNPKYIGVFIWNQYYYETTTNKEGEIVKTRKKRPASEWEIYVDREMSIIPINRWKEARRKLARKSNKNSGNRGNGKLPTTLFSGALVCDSCGKQLKLRRSTKEFKSLYCPNGPTHAHGCKLSSSKSTRIIEESLLAFIRENVLTEEHMRELVTKANDWITSISKEPQGDARPLKADIARKKQAIQKQFERIESLSNDEQELLEAYESRIRQLKKEVHKLTKEVIEIERNLVETPQPLTFESVSEYLPKLRDVLSLEIPQAAEALFKLTGPIRIRQEKVEGKRRLRWVATFSPNLLRMIGHLTKKKNSDCPFEVTLGSQRHRSGRNKHPWLSSKN